MFSKGAVSYTHLDVYKRQDPTTGLTLLDAGNVLGGHLSFWKVLKSLNY